ncbi:hypothetical protein ES319_D12G123000v1 [Gossypium barbadense]|uniref:ARID domain-containing protein n=2 Tax=Gossypium barbadense TaxID=3634 RepID=A0A5J5NYA6_GOSBA|nr:hypothetical protein ES319_D12G123000v1 [Gossypium barbadense]
MAGWSMRADGSSLDCAKTLEKLEPALVDLDPFSEGLFLKSEPDKIRFWFNKFLGLFLKEVCAQGCYRPLPPLLADGQPVDLFKLFLVVSENGGYNAVSNSGLWDLVAKESGFDLNVASSLKLVYVKYLVSLERWLEQFFQSEDSKIESNCSGHLMELGAELKGFLLESKKKVMEYSQVEESIVAGSDGGDKCVKGEESMRIDLTKRVLRYEEVENLQNDDDLKSTLVENLQNDDDLKSTVVDSECEKRFILIDVDDMPSDMAKSATNSMCNEDEDCVECKQYTDIVDDDDVMILDSNSIKENFSSHKRKRDSTWEMLNWVNEVAKDPCALVVGSLPESSKWTAYGSEELWKQVLLFREAAFGRKDDSSSAGQSNLQKNQKMHPFMYDDDNGKFGYNLRERLSCTRKVFFGKMTSKGQDRSQPSSSGNHSDLDGSTIGISKHLHGICDSATPGSVFDYDVDIQVPIGPLFQVEVPEWTGVVSESDSKWLGTRVWPLEKKENRTFIELDRIGKGRPDSCGCHIQNSIQCVRFHVSQKRMKIKLELGSAFNKWNFDQMGEYVAIAWGEEEKSMFSSIIKSNSPSLDKSFWDEIYKYFRNKSREELVCYYYNAFLLQRRANQNRTTPSNINSDDEEPEEESESVSKGSKREAIKPYTSILISPKKSHKRTRYSS